VEHLLADTGLWYALFDARDPYHHAAREKAEYLDMFRVVVPWPILYETLRTRFVRNTKALGYFESYIKKSHITFLDDSPYRDAALGLAFQSALVLMRPLSLVDCAIRLVLDDVNTKIDYLVTFNERDFLDICQRRGIEIV